MSRFYWAYGSNLDIAQMQRRCPGAEPINKLVIPNCVLRFRGVADVAYLKGAECPGGLWTITEENEQALDHYEGVNHQKPLWGLYEKKYLRFTLDGKKERALYYQMNETGIMPPPEDYLATIARGYADFGLDVDRLQRAVDHSWRRKRKTNFLRQRWKRRGCPPLAHGVSAAGVAPTVAPVQQREEPVRRLRKRPYIYKVEDGHPEDRGWYWTLMNNEYEDGANGPYRTASAAYAAYNDSQGAP